MVSRKVKFAKRQEIHKSSAGIVGLDQITGADSLKAAPRWYAVPRGAVGPTLPRFVF
jgi:hypothetical protein